MMEEENPNTNPLTKKAYKNNLGAVILIYSGIVFLLNNFNIIPFSFWESLIRYWPLLLILTGVQLLLGKNRFSSLLITTLGAVFLILFLVIFITNYNQEFAGWLKTRIPGFNPENFNFLIS